MVSYGSERQHILKAGIGDTDIFKHYTTRYNSSYGAHHVKFQPANFEEYCSGYKSNERPVVQYSLRLDDLDYPWIQDQIKTNYISITKKDYKPFYTVDGSEPLPGHRIYSHQPTWSSTNIPTAEQLKFKGIRKRMNNLPLEGVLPTLKPKSDHKLEGPIYKTNYGPPKLHPDAKAYDTILGPKEGSAFTNNTPLEETTTGNPVDDWHPGRGGIFTHRPTGKTHYNDHYTKFLLPDGTEPLRQLPEGSLDKCIRDRKNGFIKGNKQIPEFAEYDPNKVHNNIEDMAEFKREKLRKEDPCEYQDAKFRATDPTHYRANYTGTQVQPPSKMQQLDKHYVGNKERTANSLADNYVQQNGCNPVDRFVTHYSTKYNMYSGGQKINERYGNVSLQTSSPMIDAYTRYHDNPNLEKGGTDIKTRLGDYDHYQGRSFVARDTIPYGPI